MTIFRCCRSPTCVIKAFCSSTAPKTTYHKRPLPAPLVSLSSPEGKQIFREAMNEGNMESFFALSEQFITQSDPAFCSLSSLAMVLNALNYDPKRVWKGSWRWVSEEMLQCEAPAVCCHSLAKIKSNGMDFAEFVSLAACHNVQIQSWRAESSNPDKTSNLFEFRKAIQKISSSDKAESFMIVNFSRKFLGQTGDGHYSPIGGYHQQRDLVLIMDVARFKYPPYWVSLSSMWNSMRVKDDQTGLSRGYFIVSIPNGNNQISNNTSSILSSIDSKQSIRIDRTCNHERMT